MLLSLYILQPVSLEVYCTYISCLAMLYAVHSLIIHVTCIPKVTLLVNFHCILPAEC